MSNDAPLTLEQAITLLEITNITEVTESDLKRLRQRAMRRWHPDRILYAKPDPEVVAEYKRNFQKIEEAVAKIAAFLNGDIDAGRRKSGEDLADSEPPEEFVRRHAGTNQATVRECWSEVQSRAFEMQDEDVVLTEGMTVSAALNEDLADRVPGVAVLSLGAGFLIFMIALFPVLLLAAILESTVGDVAASILPGLWLVAWGVQTLASVLVLLPLSRYWLPGQISDPAISIVNRTLDLIRGWSNDSDGFGRYAWIALNLLAGIVHWVIALPVYKLAGALMRGKMIGRNVIRLRYYCGFSKPYIERLMAADGTRLAQEELFDLAMLASRFSTVR